MQLGEALPLFIFACRGVPFESTGFSPLELLFGQQAREPLEVLCNQWISSSRSPKSATEWLQENGELLANIRKIAEINQTRAKTAAKTHHDSTASDKCFEINDLVLVFSLVVTGKATEKLRDTWQGPYKVISKVAPDGRDVLSGDA